MSRDDHIWELIIVDTHGGTLSIYGLNEVLNEAELAWQIWIVSGEPSANALLTVHGFQDNASRDEIKLTVDLNQVYAMSLRKWF